jgi:hypothetical protein
MPREDNQQIARAFVQLTKRAENADPATLVQTFVDFGTLLPSISTRDNQVIFGRRGTGKTHALIFTLESAKARGELAIYVDLRRVGSTSSIYLQTQTPVSERATRMLLDVLQFVHNELTLAALENERMNLAIMGPLLDELGESITQVRVEGNIVVEEQAGTSSLIEETSSATAVISRSPSLNINDSVRNNSAASKTQRVSESGALTHWVHFGSLSAALAAILSALPVSRLILALDEWVAIPHELQPYLADLLRRALFPVRGIVVKIAAIEQRSTFKLSGGFRDYIGIEVGADVSTEINLDDFMVFENDETRATRFLRDLVYKHYMAEVPGTEIASAEELVRLAFTQTNAFEEFVKASEGVPRDAINILSIAAQKASDTKISIPHIRSAARIWYQRGKEAAVNSDPDAQRLLHWIIDQVIGSRRSRAFLLLAGTQHHLVDTLFDERVLHVIKKGISARDQPGIRYDAFKIDYGAYVELIATDHAPKGLLALDEGGDEFVDVPPDDYRAIRRAILNVAEFESQPAFMAVEGDSVNLQHDGSTQASRRVLGFQS